VLEFKLQLGLDVYHGMRFKESPFCPERAVCESEPKPQTSTKPQPSSFKREAGGLFEVLEFEASLKFEV
jgi:hypothetical protein